ncbi:MAG: hypothetical protein J5J00_10750, partial [Deltaproteobacteria bacterium]|nr:hypothetical protein [Deltaproteobacteria bacterium]
QDIPAIPQLHADIRERINEASFALAQKVELHKPNDSFGMRVFHHMNELADQAPDFAKTEGMTPHEAGLLTIILRGHDVGRHIAALPFNERKEYLPAGESPESWRDDKGAQHWHGELSLAFLKLLCVLDGLPSQDRTIIEEAVLYHGVRTVPLERTSPSFKFCQLVRDIDRIDLLQRGDYTTVKGAHGQFLLWGTSQSVPRDLVEQVLNDSPAIEAACTDYLAAHFGSNEEILSERRAALRAECSEKHEKAVADQIINWFEAKPRPEFLGRLADWTKGSLAEPPSLSKEEMIENYSSYMIAQVAIAFQVESPSVIKILMERDFLAERLAFLERRLESGHYSNYIIPAVDKLYGQMRSRRA